MSKIRCCVYTVTTSMHSTEGGAAGSHFTKEVKHKHGSDDKTLSFCGNTMMRRSGSWMPPKRETSPTPMPMRSSEYSDRNALECTCPFTLYRLEFKIYGLG